ncbi:MAG: hypothetical protein ACTHJW_15735 [Streptosporangiaceae bacterium]
MEGRGGQGRGWGLTAGQPEDGGAGDGEAEPEEAPEVDGDGEGEPEDAAEADGDGLRLPLGATLVRGLGAGDVDREFDT